MVRVLVESKKEEITEILNVEWMKTIELGSTSLTAVLTLVVYSRRMTLFRTLFVRKIVSDRTLLNQIARSSFYSANHRLNISACANVLLI